MLQGLATVLGDALALGDLFGTTVLSPVGVGILDLERI